MEGISFTRQTRLTRQLFYTNTRMGNEYRLGRSTSSLSRRLL